jgi:hypothetical protein
MPEIVDELDGPGHSVLAVPDLMRNREVGEDVVEEQVGEPQAAAQLQARPGPSGRA